MNQKRISWLSAVYISLEYFKFDLTKLSVKLLAVIFLIGTFIAVQWYNMYGLCTKGESSKMQLYTSWYELWWRGINQRI